MNTLKTTVLMAALMGILIAIGGAVGGTTGALLMFVISLGMNIFMYWTVPICVLEHMEHGK